ncbi:MAG TPA: Crp/Fnr family transcriptional regulator [Puia sp.]|uniref:Crp/Fnr family transcriptional regulator n=1 Tax=Puia sp. TaxID=2045100 RepID=UPI002C1128EF|nr:Crp/Fnr family transcriptional regulator [Puia sp.]HVU94322.1 Crp/Fnr family transcriptional regulator [Puia sp.]
MTIKEPDTESQDACDLNRCFLCRHCLPEWQDAINGARKMLAFKKGQTIFREGDEVRGIYFINDGAVKVHQSWGDGKEFILRFATAGAILGHRGYSAGTAFPISATALENTRVCFITTEFLEATFSANPPFVYTMMRLYASELQQAERRIRDLAVQPVKTRVADALFTIRDIFGTGDAGFIRLPITRLDIASYAGTTYEAVFRLMSEWRDKGWIATAGKKFRINDETKLRS